MRLCGAMGRWKERWFKIQDRVLYCYTKQDGQLRRAIPLESAEVKVIDNPRYPHPSLHIIRPVFFFSRGCGQDWHTEAPRFALGQG